MQHNERRSARGEAAGRRHDARLRQLLHLARSGDQDAMGDLWREYQFDYEREGARDDLD